MGMATVKILLRHSERGSPAKAMAIGISTITPSVSPSHQVNQFIAKVSFSRVPSAVRPVTESVELTRHITGDSSRTRMTSLTVSKDDG